MSTLVVAILSVILTVAQIRNLEHRDLEPKQKLLRRAVSTRSKGFVAPFGLILGR